MSEPKDARQSMYDILLPMLPQLREKGLGTPEAVIETIVELAYRNDILSDTVIAMRKVIVSHTTAIKAARDGLQRVHDSLTRQEGAVDQMVAEVAHGMAILRSAVGEPAPPEPEVN